MCLYVFLCLGQGDQKGCPRWAPMIDGLYNTDMGAMKAEGQARLELPRNVAASLWAIACAVPRGGTGCTRAEGIT